MLALAPQVKNSACFQMSKPGQGSGEGEAVSVQGSVCEEGFPGELGNWKAPFP